MACILLYFLLIALDVRVPSLLSLMACICPTIMIYLITICISWILEGTWMPIMHTRWQMEVSSMNLFSTHWLWPVWTTILGSKIQYALLSSKLNTHSKQMATLQLFFQAWKSPQIAVMFFYQMAYSWYPLVIPLRTIRMSQSSSKTTITLIIILVITLKSSWGESRSTKIRFHSQ